MPQKTISISNGTIIRFLFFVLLIMFFYAIRDTVAIIFFSIVVASAVQPAAKFLQKYYLPKTLSVVAIYLISFILLGLIFYLVVPPLFFEVSNFLNDSQLSFKDFPDKIIFKFYEKLNIPISFSGLLNQITRSLENFLPQFSGGFFGTITNVFGGIVSFILIIVLSFYFSVQDGGIENFLRIITPSSYESYVLSVWKRAQNKISKWLRGQLFLGLLVGVFVFIGLTLLGIKYALSLALIASVFELIPIFGPVLSSIPAIIIGFLQEPWLGIAVLILYLIIQQAENHIIYPLVMRKVIGVPSILVIIALLIGAKLAGIFGILLSVPVTVIVIELFNDFAEKKKIVL